jgi:hypothetical protein
MRQMIVNETESVNTDTLRRVTSHVTSDPASGFAGYMRDFSANGCKKPSGAVAAPYPPRLGIQGKIARAEILKIKRRRPSSRRPPQCRARGRPASDALRRGACEGRAMSAEIERAAIRAAWPTEFDDGVRCGLL